jgi:SpoVK/Ycf46/Vps4 family AAA+-type ATPase
MMCRKLTSLDLAFDMDEIVMKTPGFVGADLSALIDEALVVALNRYEFKSCLIKYDLYTLFRKMNADLNTSQSSKMIF